MNVSDKMEHPSCSVVRLHKDPSKPSSNYYQAQKPDLLELTKWDVWIPNR